MDIKLLASQILQGERRAIARGLTLVESSQAHHESLSLELFECLGRAPRAFRLGVTGPPGAGKSTLVERLALSWLKKNDKVAILAIDPSSRKTGGSLLGDKTRMGAVADHPDVFIRPSPNGAHLGGLGRRTPLMCALLERAGFRRIIVETVGVGQSEVAASYHVDKLLLVALPGAGDEVQGIKRGLMEEVDLVAVNKSDLGQARATVAVLRSAFRVFRREVPVLAISALEGEGLEALLKEVDLPCGGSERERALGEAQFLDQFLLESLKQILCQPESRWSELRESVLSGERDLLEVLPLAVKELNVLRETIFKSSNS